MKVGLYGISYAGIWYRDRVLSVEEFLERAKRFGFDGIEIDGKRPHGFPLDWDVEKRRGFRDLAESKGIEIVGVASNNNFVSPIVEQRENELIMLAEQIKLCRDLGGKVVRVFLAWRGITIVDGLANYEIPRKYGVGGNYPDVTRWQQWKWAKDCLREAAEIAEEHGVILALQNHEPVIRHHKDIIDMVREVDSEYLKCCLDAPLLTEHSDEYVRQAALEVGDLQVLSHFGGEFTRDGKGKAVMVPIRGREQDPLPNYPAFIRAMKEIGYDGYINYELCHPVLNEQHEHAGLELVDHYVECAGEYMRNLIAEVGV